jgi:hypothetical protein
MAVTIYKNQPKETNSGTGRAAIRFDSNGTITLANLSTNNTTDNVTSFSITNILWSTSNNITIARGGNTILTLFGTDHWNLGAMGLAENEFNTGNLVVTINTGGSAIIEVSKK